MRQKAALLVILFFFQVSSFVSHVFSSTVFSQGQLTMPPLNRGEWAPKHLKRGNFDLYPAVSMLQLSSWLFNTADSKQKQISPTSIWPYRDAKILRFLSIPLKHLISHKIHSWAWQQHPRRSHKDIFSHKNNKESCSKKRHKRLRAT